MYANVIMTGTVEHVYEPNADKATFALVRSYKTVNEETSFVHTLVKFSEGYEQYTGKIEPECRLSIFGRFLVSESGGPIFDDNDGQPKFVVIPHVSRCLGKAFDSSKNDEFSVILLGNIGKDPEMRFTANGNAVTNLNVATSRRYTVKGSKTTETTWWRCAAWGKQAETLNEYCKKGMKILLECYINYDEKTHGPKTYEKTKTPGEIGSNFEVTVFGFTFVGGGKGTGPHQLGTLPEEADGEEPETPAEEETKNEKPAPSSMPKF